jgi:hypothetical protein
MIAPDIISDMKEHMKEQLLKDKSATELTKQTKTQMDEDIQKYLEANKINVLKCNNQIKELHTLLRDKETSHSDFKFYSDRLVNK